MSAWNQRQKTYVTPKIADAISWVTVQLILATMYTAGAVFLLGLACLPVLFVLSFATPVFYDTLMLRIELFIRRDLEPIAVYAIGIIAANLALLVISIAFEQIAKLEKKIR